MSVKNFILHLRPHYQVGILSAAYLLALLYHPHAEWGAYLSQFVNIHLLLFGGATAFNSYWDRDEGPVGGLRHPPPVAEWMRVAALLMMLGSVIWALEIGYVYAGICLVSAVLFWGYSSPALRWKGRPLASIFVIALSTGVNSFLMGVLAAGSSYITWIEAAAAVGVGAMLVSLYPVSQIYQRKIDKSRGDITFAVCYGVKAVKRFFVMAYSAGLVLVGGSMVYRYPEFGGIFFVVALLVGGGLYYRIRILRGIDNEYDGIMRLKYGTSLAFNVFILLSWFVIYYFGI
jgi:1,4-dihydroxy-2-naphthoate octaprenyltransferase